MAEPEQKTDELKGTLTKKQRLLHELKEIALTMLYLAGTLSVLETYKSLILLQLGINAFGQNYTFALLEALMLGKIVVLAKDLKFLKASPNRSLAQAVLFQSVMMTLITDVGGKIEDALFPHAASLIERSGDPVALMITHQVAAMSIFIVYFTVVGLDKMLGPKTLWRLLFVPAAARETAQ
jgi:hypothetical protein